ncbi:MAG: RsmB/NOP family class I SAM-dependent RNA methyltransferase [Nocardioides sp.]
MPERRRRRPQVQRPADKPRVDPARLAAFEVLKAVRVEGAYTNLVLPHTLRRFDLSGRDAGFATELAAGTIRWQGTYDAVLARCVDRNLAKVEAKVLDALRLGCHQLLAMRVPTHAAINTSVDLVRERANSGAAGFANAVLRKVAAHDLEGWQAELAPALDAVWSHPSWVVDALADALEAVGARGELADLLAADNVAPKVTVVARPGRVPREEIPGEPTPFSPYGVVCDGGDPGAIPAVAAGAAGVQDEGSQLVAIAAAGVPIDGTDRVWLDLCAGPGGKAALLAALAAHRGAGVVANEAQQHRSGLVAANLRGADGVIGVVTGDGTRPPFAEAGFDRVLVDAPCTGLGALRRRPEARWRRTPADLVALTALQTALLSNAIELTRPGGIVVYATCSPVLAETRGVIDEVLAKRDDIELVPVGLEIPESAGPIPGTVQLWPHRHQTDAMFIAALRRR